MFHQRPQKWPMSSPGHNSQHRLRQASVVALRFGSGRLLPGLMALVAFSILAFVRSAAAHGGEDLTDGNALQSWHFTTDIVLPTLLVLIVYVRGMIRRAAFVRRIWRHVLFFAGVAAVFVALQSPIDPVAERLFFVHQIQHFLLRMFGPMLIALSQPQAMLIAGLPSAVRRMVLAPVASSGYAKRLFVGLTHPVAATIIFVGSLYFWQIPRYHNRALLDEPLHYLMHVTMLLAGGLFWWQIFDQRAQPKGLRHGVRLMMLWVAILSNILLGSYMTLKTTILYGAYDQLGRLYGYSPLADEQLGGMIIWIPSSMMCLLAVIIVIHQFGRHETLLEARRNAWSPRNSDILLHPTTGAALVEQAKPKNRVMAFGFALFAAAMFSVAILAGIVSQAHLLPQTQHAEHADRSPKIDPTTGLF